MKMLAIYLMCGADTPELAEAAVEGGADLVELGFPFSDPLADGPGIRLAGEPALDEGMRTAMGLECLVEGARGLTTLPRSAGFGISTPEQAAAAAAIADGVVVGSRAVEVALDGPFALRDYVSSLREAVDSAAAVSS